MSAVSREKGQNGWYPNGHSALISAEPELKAEEASLGDVVVKLDMRTKVVYSKLPWGIWLLEKLGLCSFHPTLW